MSTFEYNDLYLKCQDTGLYHIYIFDIIGTENMPPSIRKEAQIKMIELMNKIYMAIEKIEETTGKKILVFEEDFITYKSGQKSKGFGYKIEPFLFNGDVFGFTAYRDSIDNNLVYSIYEYYKKELNINFDFHTADGYYETNDYSLGNEKYFRGYCMDLLSSMHKEDTIKELNRLKRKLKI